MTSQVEELKSKADAAFSAGENDQAVNLYTQAINLDEKNYVLYSNRSAVYAKLNKYEDALKDAEKCIALKPDFIQGYLRKGTALSFLNRYDDAIRIYEEGLKIDSNNQELLTDLENVRKYTNNKSIANEIGFFSNPQFIHQLVTNPKAQQLLQDPETAKLMKLLQDQPNNTTLLTNPKVLKLIGTVLDVGTGNSHGNQKAMNVKKQTNTSTTTTTNEQQNKTLTPEQKQAEEQKEKGNEAYKKKDFETALNYYNKATELDPNNMIYYTNRAAVYFEQKRWDDCIKQCEKAIDIGRENKADYKLIAKACVRIGNVKVQEKNYQEAIKYFNRSLLEYRNPDIIKRKEEIEKILKEQEQLAYFNPELSEQEKTKGNEFFQKADYPNALKHYTEAIKRNPSNARLYSNRAACFIKLMEFGLALKDSEEGIKIDPTFVECYLHKGHALMATKNFSQAMIVFKKVLETHPNNQEAMEGYQQCTVGSSDDPEEVLQRALADSEIQQILDDPTMCLILDQIQNEPLAIREHLRDPTIAQKIHKLMDAGIITIHPM
ncbi:unnamed protein product [Rotaria sordida]|uniref:Stress-induced-phosphoprotein 1 n=1 Tax=Rotaria sordida TaxID=392033 RepID=A0A816C0Y2_9BILA|nr:unnamed protein product [Rotaria sordida]CAF1379571.1 unnamed protein product [Rotaria sordida]CAF1401067.1 unnamed protein product [Rotaria sordida]CAF1458496.1 unnamed protein product [Rotaria sordida]CAF1615453.1 unnamed protein product [Rotaria sordida]